MNRWICAALVLFTVEEAHAYDEHVHTFLVHSALKDNGTLYAHAPPIPEKAPEAVRMAIDRWARSSSDAAIKEEWLRRYPSPESFDAWAFKEFLLFAPEAKVFGIDRLPEGFSTIHQLLEIGSRQPDDDYRNRDRFAYSPERKKLDNIPADPAILNMGKLGALSSQAHAHYGLANVEFSSDSDVLKEDPRRFAIAAGYPNGPVLTLAADMAQMHLDLALIAAFTDPANASLAWLYTGHGLHYLQDATNQIHTVQVGIYDFFVDATKAQMVMAAKTGGGYLGDLRSMPSIGIDILTNHHTLSEVLTRKRLLAAKRGELTPEGSRLLVAPEAKDREVSAELEALLSSWPRPYEEQFGSLLTRAVIEVSSREGAAVYAATRAIADPRYRQEGVLFDDQKDDPDAALVPVHRRDQQAYEDLFRLQELAFRRAGTAMRKWIHLEQLAMSAAIDERERERMRSKVIDRLVHRQLRALREAEQRRKDYLANPPAEAGKQHMPIMLAGELGVFAIFALALRRLLRGKNRGRSR